MKEEWLFPGAMVPVDMETTAALVAEIKRLIDVVGGMALAQPEQKPVAREHVTDSSKCWCDPELDYKDPDTGVEVWVHRSKQ